MAFNFDRAEFRNMRLEVPYFGNEVSFIDSVFTGANLFYGATFKGGVDLSDAKIRGYLRIIRVTLCRNFYAHNLEIGVAGELEVAQSWAPEPAQLLLHATVVRGRLSLSVHPSEHLRVHVSDLQARQGSAVTVAAHGHSAASLALTDWVVLEQACVRLPDHSDLKAEAWLVTGVSPTAEVSFE